MNLATVSDYIESAQENDQLGRTHLKGAGAAIAQFLLVRDGLRGNVSEEKLDDIAATLTAGLISSNSQ